MNSNLLKKAVDTACEMQATSVLKNPKLLSEIDKATEIINFSIDKLIKKLNEHAVPSTPSNGFFNISDVDLNAETRFEISTEPEKWYCPKAYEGGDYIEIYKNANIIGWVDLATIGDFCSISGFQLLYVMHNDGEMTVAFVLPC